MSYDGVPRSLVRLNAALALGFGTFFLMTTAYLWMRFHVHLPVRDTLREMPIVINALEHGFLSQGLADWFAPLSGVHRIAVIRFLMYLDFKFFDGQNHLIYAASWLSILTVIGVFIRALAKSYPTDSLLRFFAVGLALIFLCSLTQIWNLTYPMNSSWYIGSAASIVAIYLISKEPESPSTCAFLGAYAMAGLAAFSNFFGVIVWLLLPPLIGLRSGRAGVISAFFSALLLALYLSGIPTAIVDQTTAPDLLPPTALLDVAETTTLDKVKFFADAKIAYISAVIPSTLVYLGAPLSIDHPVLASILVLFSLMAVALGWRELIKARVNKVPGQKAWFEMMVTTATLMIGVAVATQFGRILVTQPTNHRFQTIVMIYWLCVCGILLHHGWKYSRINPTRQFATTSLCLGIAAVLLVNTHAPIGVMVNVAVAANRTAALELLGISDEVANRFLISFNHENVLPGMEPFFRRHQTAYWAPVDKKIAFKNSTQCLRTNFKAERSKWPGVTAVAGQIQNRWSEFYRQIPITTEQGEVIGHLTPRYRPNETLLTVLSGERNTWEAYLDKNEGLPDFIYLHYRSSLLSELPCRVKLRCLFCSTSTVSDGTPHDSPSDGL